MKRPLHEVEEKEEEVVEDVKTPVYEYDEDDQAMRQMEDSGSIPTTMGVREAFLEKGEGECDGDGGGGGSYPFLGYTLHRAPSREFREFVIPQTPAALAAAAAEVAEEARNGQEDMQQSDDDISVLTEFSGMEEEEDASSQVTTGTEARTVVTTTTGSTTIPTRHVGQVTATSLQQQHKITKRRNAAVDKNNGFPPMDNSQYKRRRMR
jgi:hypothetical protein